MLNEEKQTKARYVIPILILGFIASLVGLLLGVITWPVGFKQIGEFNNCSRVVSKEFGGESVIFESYAGNPFKGDFVQEQTPKALDMTCAIKSDTLKFDKYTYFFTYENELRYVGEYVNQRILMGKWPSLYFIFGKPLSDNKIRLYRINRDGANWPKP